MKKNLRSIIESWQESQAQILVDMNQYDLIESTGMKPDLSHKKSAHMSAAWRLRDLDRVVIPMGGSDLSGIRYLAFSICSAGAAGATFRLVFSNSHTGENTGGYETTVCIAKDGWNDYRFEIPFLHGTGKCTGSCRSGSRSCPETPRPPAESQARCGSGSCSCGGSSCCGKYACSCC